MRDQLPHLLGVFVREVEVNVRVGMFLQLREHLWCRRPQYLVNLGHLVELVRSWEERVKRQHLEEDAAHAPHVHLIVVEPVCKEALGGAVPASRYVLRVGLLRIDAAATAEIGQFQLVVRDQDVLGLREEASLSVLWERPP